MIKSIAESSSPGKLIERGGTGYDINKKLPAEIDSQQPDYSLYPVSNWYDGKTAYGFLTRGCIRKCPWCIVPQKEGSITPYADIETVLRGRKAAVLTQLGNHTVTISMQSMS
jgi:tRNA A37 methylthiotransferase MiaB